MRTAVTYATKIPANRAAAGGSTGEKPQGVPGLS
jgi:hypothetical protein